MENQKPPFQCKICKRQLGYVQLITKPDPDEKCKSVYVCKLCGGYVRLNTN